MNQIENLFSFGEPPFVYLWTSIRPYFRKCLLVRKFRAITRNTLQYLLEHTSWTSHFQRLNSKSNKSSCTK